ncbi:MAG: hypothetical protein KDK39_06350 [Leptospiraceae bacterium]|nr:hypothetical protein [Leptospiraceae bacterium]
MKTLLEEEASDTENYDPEVEDFGPDPVLLRKKGLRQFAMRNMHDFKSRINDEAYLEHAIERIAVELMHHLVK